MPDESTFFSTVVEPWELSFNAAHFITYQDVCENLHGHNFHAKIKVGGRNTENAFVVDFVALKRIAADICFSLDDRVLLPGKSSLVRLEESSDAVVSECLGKRFVLPRENCMILPVSNTTAEMLAWYIGQELLKRLRQENALANIDSIEVAVEEADRQWGVCVHRL